MRGHQTRDLASPQVFRAHRRTDVRPRRPPAHDCDPSDEPNQLRGRLQGSSCSSEDGGEDEERGLELQLGRRMGGGCAGVSTVTRLGKACQCHRAAAPWNTRTKVLYSASELHAQITRGMSAAALGRSLCNNIRDTATFQLSQPISYDGAQTLRPAADRQPAMRHSPTASEEVHGVVGRVLRDRHDVPRLAPVDVAAKVHRLDQRVAAQLRHLRVAGLPEPDPEDLGVPFAVGWTPRDPWRLGGTGKTARARCSDARIPHAHPAASRAPQR